MRTFAAFFCLSVSAWAAQVPYLRTSVGPLPLARIQQEKSLEDKDSPSGVGTIGMRGTTIAYDFNGGKLAGNRITFETLSFAVRFNELSLTTTQLVPVIKVSTVRKEKVIAGKRIVYDEPTKIEAKESKPIHTAYQNVKVTAVTKPGTNLSLLLPERVGIRISEGPVVKLKDREAVAKAFQESLDRTLGTDSFWDGLEIKTENLPGIVDFAVGQRDLWKKPVVEAAKAEVARESFLASLEKKLTEELPPLKLNGKDLDAEIGLGADGYLTLALGRAAVTDKVSGSFRFQAEIDEGGLTLAVRAFLDLVRRGKAGLSGLDVDSSQQAALIPLQESEKASAARLLTELGLGRFEASNLKALAIDLSGRVPAVADIETDGFSLSVPLVAISVHEAVAPFPFSLRMKVTLDQGQLVVTGLSTQTDAKLEGTAWERLQGTMKLLALSAVASREAQKLQNGAPNLHWAILTEPEPRLRLSID